MPATSNTFAGILLNIIQHAEYYITIYFVILFCTRSRYKNIRV